MTMTNQTGISATETVRTDIRIGGNIRLPNGQLLSEDAQILLDKSIVAKPLGIAPNEAIEIKNTSYRYRWVNRFGQNGAMFAKRKSQGFTLATTADVQPKSVEITNDNGEIRLGDLVMMKIPVERYQQAMKANMERALILQRDKRTLSKYLTNEAGEMPSTNVFSDDKVVSHNAASETKVSGPGKYVTNFVPTDAELDAKMGPEKSGRK
jgi:hypothetical protein